MLIFNNHPTIEDFLADFTSLYHSCPIPFSLLLAIHTAQACMWLCLISVLVSVQSNSSREIHLRLRGACFSEGQGKLSAGVFDCEVCVCMCVYEFRINSTAKQRWSSKQCYLDCASIIEQQASPNMVNTIATSLSSDCFVPLWSTQGNSTHFHKWDPSVRISCQSGDAKLMLPLGFQLQEVWSA